MTKISVKRFVELLQKSELLPDTVLRDALTQIKHENNEQPLADTDQVTRRLVEMALITSWQCEKLLSQKYKGFFLGKYKILGHIGTGGMSSVYLVEHVQMHQRRAIKVLPRKRVSDKTYLERFYFEARASATLDHRNIVRALDVDHDPDSDTHYLVMEFVDGRDVGKIVQEEGPLAPRDAADYIAQAANALQFAHDQGVVHRDVKPGNLLVDKNNEIKILDMGLALFKKDEYSLTLEYNEKILGTADYLAPEQAMNSHTVDHRADIYGLGCTLFYMLTGHPPFNEGTLAQRIAMHQKKEPPTIATFRNDCPQALQEILHLMMVKDPDQRFQACSQVSSVCRNWLAGKPLYLPAQVGVVAESSEAGEKSALLPEDSSVLSYGTENRITGSPEFQTTSTEDTVCTDKTGLAKGNPASSSKSKIQLSAVSFSDIVAGSEVHSSSMDVAVNGRSGNRQRLVPDDPKLAAGHRLSRSIEITPIYLVIIVLVSVFASSAFTVLCLNWLGILGH